MLTLGIGAITDGDAWLAMDALAEDSPTWWKAAGAGAADEWAVEDAIAERIEDGNRNAVGCGIEEEDDALDETDRGESAGLLACDTSRDSTGDAAAGDTADGVGGR